MPDRPEHPDGIRKTALKFARLVVALALVAVLFAAIVRIELPYLVVEPGPATDVSKLVKIDAETYSSRGSFLLATALIRATGGVNVPTAVSALFDSERDLVTRQSIFPSGTSRTQTDQIHTAQMSESQEEGAVAALAELGMRSTPDGAFVRQATGDAPAAKVLRPGDVVTEVDGKPVPKLADLLEAVGSRPAGSSLRVTVKRGEDQKVFSVKTIEDRETKKTRIGVEVIQNRRLPVVVKALGSDIGGPSAGLMFALSIYDSLTPGDLTGGRKIAGTGTISNPGRRTGLIGAVGAVSLKLKGAETAGARVFLAPPGDAGEAKKAAGPKTRVLEVSTLREAIKELEKLRTG